MKKLFGLVAAALAMVVAGNGWAADEEYMEPKLYTTAPNFGPERPCPHYAGGCRSRIAGWLAHLDAEAEEPVRVALYNYGYRNARQASIAAHRAVATEAKMAILGEGCAYAREGRNARRCQSRDQRIPDRGCRGPQGR